MNCILVTLVYQALDFNLKIQHTPNRNETQIPSDSLARPANNNWKNQIKVQNLIVERTQNDFIFVSIYSDTKSN